MAKEMINIPKDYGEIWKQINGHPDYYISNLGRVYSFKRSGKILTPCIDRFGYCMLHLWEENKQHMVKVHRLVAEHFIPNPDNLSDVNHKDENKQNNKVENLEWCNRQYNLNHGTRNIRASKSLKKPVIMINSKTFEILKRFDSALDAEKETGIIAGNISRVCTKHRKTTGGYIWKFAEEEDYVGN